MDHETAIAVLQEQVSSLKGRLGSLEVDVQQKFDRLEKKLDEALNGRPTWSTTLLLGGLMTICTGLGVFVLTR